MKKLKSKPNRQLIEIYSSINRFPHKGKSEVKKMKIIKNSENIENSIDKYVMKDLLKTFYFLLFSLLIIFLTAVITTDYGFAVYVRESVSISKVSF